MPASSSKKKRGKKKRTRRIPDWVVTVPALITLFIAMLNGSTGKFSIASFWLCAVSITIAVLRFPLTLSIPIGTASLLTAGWLTFSELEDRKDNQLGIALLPDSQDRPELQEPIPEDDLLVLVGNSEYSGMHLPFDIIRQSGRSVISVSRHGHRGIALSAEFFNAEGKIVASIRDNRTQFNQKTFWRKDQTKHRLQIVDEENNVILDLEYLNPNTMRFWGNFYLRRGVPFNVERDGPIHSSFGTISRSVSRNCHLTVFNIP